MRSRSKCPIFSSKWTSCISTGPELPAVLLFWSFSTGAPKPVVYTFFSFFSCFIIPPPNKRLVKSKGHRFTAYQKRFPCPYQPNICSLQPCPTSCCLFYMPDFKYSFALGSCQYVHSYAKQSNLYICLHYSPGSYS